MGTCIIADHTKPLVDNRHVIAWHDDQGFHIGIVRTEHDEIVLGESVNEPSGELSDWLGQRLPVTNIRHRALSLNQYYPRVFRPWVPSIIVSVHQPDKELEQAALAIDVLLDQMNRLFRVIEPDLSNLNAFGHEIRNLLLLACMEVEAGLAAVLRANGVTKDRLNTSDYVRLLAPLRLSEYELKLQSFPSLRGFSPFAGWDASKPTKSLLWYDAYNQTKHDRERNFAVATLERAIEATVAALIVFYAQFGKCDKAHGLTMSALQRGLKWPTG